VSTHVFDSPVRILLYSDGLIDLAVKPEGLLGERTLIKTLVKTHNQIQNQNNAITFYTKFHAMVKEINGGAAYTDDLSYLIIDFH